MPLVKKVLQILVVVIGTIASCYLIKMGWDVLGLLESTSKLELTKEEFDTVLEFGSIMIAFGVIGLSIIGAWVLSGWNGVKKLLFKRF